MSEQVYRLGRGPRHHKPVGIEVSQAASRGNGQISAERRGAAMEVEVAIGVHGVFPLPLGIEREDRCE